MPNTDRAGAEKGCPRWGSSSLSRVTAYRPTWDYFYMTPLQRTEASPRFWTWNYALITLEEGGLGTKFVWRWPAETLITRCFIPIDAGEATDSGILICCCCRCRHLWGTELPASYKPIRWVGGTAEDIKLSPWTLIRC